MENEVDEKLQDILDESLAKPVDEKRQKKTAKALFGNNAAKQFNFQDLIDQTRALRESVKGMNDTIEKRKVTKKDIKDDFVKYRQRLQALNMQQQKTFYTQQS